jgi:hypothetical protein
LLGERSERAQIEIARASVEDAPASRADDLIASRTDAAAAVRAVHDAEERG